MHDLDYLIANSLHIVTNLEVYSRETGVKAIDLQAIRKNRGCYAANNNTLCFVTDDGKVCVTPLSSFSLKIMEDNSFQAKAFPVPFSNGEEPVNHSTFWRGLLCRAYEAQCCDYENEALQLSRGCGYGKLDNDVLDRCFRIPNMGVEVMRKDGVKAKIFPIGGSEVMFDAYMKIKIGHYCVKNGYVAFVYQDGHTYVARGEWIVPHLKNAGYTPGFMNVPFSDDEIITDDTWMILGKFVDENT